jgi:N-acyl-D-amino-acid deacylase
MTGLPAAKLGLRDRGQIAPGMAADLVVFDSEAVADRATYDQPARYPEGIHLVIVNGVIELAGEEHQGRGPGGVLQRPAGG